MNRLAFASALLGLLALVPSAHAQVVGGGGISTVTDGTNTVLGPATLKVVGGTVSNPGGSTATITVAGGSVTWPASGDIVISNGTNIPTGVVPGTGVLTALAISIGSAGAPVLFNGAGGTPSSIDLANGTLLPISGTTGYGSGVATALADAVNGAGGLLTYGLIGTSGAAVGLLDTANVFSAQQSPSITPLTISTATFTPDGSNNSYSFTLVHASCPCTLANPSATPVPGTSGLIIITQSSSGSDAIGTWGSEYEAPGGTSTISLSTGVSAVDVISYFVKDSTHILLIPIYNFSH